MRISTAIDPFVMLENNFSYWPREIERFQNIVSRLGMAAEDGNFHRVKSGRLGENLVWNANFSDVMNLCRKSQAINRVRWETHFPSD